MPDILLKIFSGYSFRKKVENDPIGDLSVIQMKNLEGQYSQIGGDLTKIKGESIPQKYHLLKGDILFIAKGANNYALVLDEVNQPTVAASAFFVLRPDIEQVVPGYLAWYINQSAAQRYFKENTAGTYIPNINLSTLKELKIKLPPLPVQKRIAQLAVLSKKEQQLLETMSEKRKILVENLLMSKVLNHEKEEC